MEPAIKKLEQFLSDIVVCGHTPQLSKPTHDIQWFYEIMREAKTNYFAADPK